MKTKDHLLELFSKKLEEIKNHETLLPETLLSWLFNNLGLAHRNAYLKQHPENKGNGFYSRTLQIGGLSFPVNIPRTRYPGFRPFFLPPGHTRYLPQDYLQLVHSFLLGSRSIQSAARALKKLGLPLNQDYLEEVVEEFVTCLQNLNSCPLPTDLAALFLDAKHIHQKTPQTQV